VPVALLAAATAAAGPLAPLSVWVAAPAALAAVQHPQSTSTLDWALTS